MPTKKVVGTSREDSHNPVNRGTPHAYADAARRSGEENTGSHGREGGAVKALIVGPGPIPFLGGAVAISMALGDAILAAIIVLVVSFGLSAVVFFFVLPTSSHGHSAS